LANLNFVFGIQLLIFFDLKALVADPGFGSSAVLSEYVVFPEMRPFDDCTGHEVIVPYLEKSQAIGQ
jgi:hypothetical protein